MKMRIKLCFSVLLFVLSFSLIAQELVTEPPLTDQFLGQTVSSFEVKYTGAIVVTFSQDFVPLNPENCSSFGSLRDNRSAIIPPQFQGAEFQGREEMLALLLAAKLTGGNVNFFTFECDTWGGQWFPIIVGLGLF